MWEKTTSLCEAFISFQYCGWGKNMVASEINDPLLLRHPVLQKLDGRYDIYWLTIEAL
jgi:hypothetical protein